MKQNRGKERKKKIQMRDTKHNKRSKGLENIEEDSEAEERKILDKLGVEIHTKSEMDNYNSNLQEIEYLKNDSKVGRNSQSISGKSDKSFGWHSLPWKKVNNTTHMKHTFIDGENEGSDGLSFAEGNGSNGGQTTSLWDIESFMNGAEDAMMMDLEVLDGDSYNLTKDKYGGLTISAKTSKSINKKLKTEKDDLKTNIASEHGSRKRKLISEKSQKDGSSEKSSVDFTEKKEKKRKTSKIEEKKRIEDVENIDLSSENGNLSSAMEGWSRENLHGVKLHPLILQNLQRLNFTTPMPIQQLSLHHSIIGSKREIDAGKDIVGIAETGSGKTLAYGIPILNYLLNLRDQTMKLQNQLSNEDMIESTKDQNRELPITGHNGSPLQALILCPTRELAMQVTNHIQELLKGGAEKGPHRIDVVPIVGGLSDIKQERLLNKKPPIVVATVGRLWELIKSNQNHLKNLSLLRFLVVDEADRMVEDGHFPEVKEILNHITQQYEKRVQLNERQKELSTKKTRRVSNTKEKDKNQIVEMNDSNDTDLYVGESFSDIMARIKTGDGVLKRKEFDESQDATELEEEKEDEPDNEMFDGSSDTDLLENDNYESIDTSKVNEKDSLEISSLGFGDDNKYIGETYEEIMKQLRKGDGKLKEKSGDDLNYGEGDEDNVEEIESVTDEMDPSEKLGENADDSDIDKVDLNTNINNLEKIDGDDNKYHGETYDEIMHQIKSGKGRLMELDEESNYDTDSEASISNSEEETNLSDTNDNIEDQKIGKINLILSPIKRQTFIFSATLGVPQESLFSKDRRVRKMKNTRNFQQSPDIISKIVDLVCPLRGEPVIVNLTAKSVHDPEGNKVSPPLKQNTKSLGDHLDKVRSVSDDSTKDSINLKFPKTLNLAYIRTLPEEKDALVYYFLQQYAGRSLVFVNTIDTLKRLVGVLNILKMVEVRGLHAQMQQKARLTVLEKFKANSQAILVCTEVAARGLDIPDVTHVIHYDMPQTIPSFVHRAGRTARALSNGFSLSLVSPKDEKVHFELLRLLMEVESGERSTEYLDFPVDSDVIPLAKERANLANKLVKAERKRVITKANKDWYMKAASDADLEVDEALLANLKEEERIANKYVNRTDVRNIEMEQDKLYLKSLLSVPLFNRRDNRKFVNFTDKTVETTITKREQTTPGTVKGIVKEGTSNQEVKSVNRNDKGHPSSNISKNKKKTKLVRNGLVNKRISSDKVSKKSSMQSEIRTPNANALVLFGKQRLKPNQRRGRKTGTLYNFN